MTSILRTGVNCELVEPARSSGVLIDARAYYSAVHAVLQTAERSVLIAGWQFDSAVPLVRGDDAQGIDAPSTLLSLIEHIVARRPELRVYILAWDYSLVLAAEREWLQRVKFGWMTDERIHFVFDGMHPAGASHHQKLVVVDGAIAFAGGIDLCDSRWDDRDHAIDNPLRFKVHGGRQKPYHDLMAYCTGPVVRSAERLFCERWQRATGAALALPPPVEHAPGRFASAVDRALPLQCSDVAISLTFGEHPPSGTAKTEQIKTLHEDAFSSAERLIYIETQYFTSRAVHAALCDRMRADRSKLEIVIVLPMGADTPKENFALGDTQRWVLSSLKVEAARHGHQLRVVCSVAHKEDGTKVPTFIHSKVLIVDDRLLTIGSANCTNRSMSLDSELNWVWECRAGEPAASDIARIRAALLCEHAGIPYDSSLEGTRGLVARLDELIGRSKLQLRNVPESPDEVDQNHLLERAFDPQQPLTELELDEWLEPLKSTSRPST